MRMPHPCGVGNCTNPRAGIVTNQPGEYDPERKHYAVSVCGSDKCRAKALGRTIDFTGEKAHYIPDPMEGTP